MERQVFPCGVKDKDPTSSPVSAQKLYRVTMLLLTSMHTLWLLMMMMMKCNETLLVMTVRQGKKFGFQSAAENLEQRRRPDRLRQTVPDRCSSRWKRAVANGRTHSAWNDQR